MLTATALADIDSALRHAEQMRLFADWLLQQHEPVLLQAVFQPSQNAVSLCAESGESMLLPYDDILYCLVSEHFSELYYHVPPLGKTVQKSLHNKPLKDWEAMLPSTLFVKVNKSCLINSKHVRVVERWDTGKGFLLTMSDGKEIKVSRNHVEKLRALCAARFPILQVYGRGGGADERAA